MKKLNLNVANLGATEILTREELKKVLGGTGTGTGFAKPCMNDICPTGAACYDEIAGIVVEGACGIDSDFPGLGCVCIVTDAPTEEP